MCHTSQKCSCTVSFKVPRPENRCYPHWFVWGCGSMFSHSYPLIMISIVKHTFCHVNPRLINPHRVLIGYHFQSLRNRLWRSPNHPVLPQKCVHFTTRIWGWPAKKWNSRWKMMTNHERCWCSDRSQIAHAVDIFVQRDLSCRHVVDPLRVAHRQTLCIRRDLPLSKDSK